MVAEKKIKELEKSAVELTVSIPQETVAEEYDKTVKKYCKKIQLKGFRKGKAPASILEQKYGPSLREETMYSIIETSVEEAIKDVEDNFKPLPYSTPKIIDEKALIFEPASDFSYTVSYDIYPKFELPKYDAHEITVPEVTVEKTEIDAELAKLQEQNSLIIEKTGTVEKDDIVTIDYAEVEDDGTVVEGTEREDFVFTVGTGYNFYKIDQEIIGMAKDEERVIKKSYGEDHDIPEYVGKTVKIKVTVKTIKVKEIPELDDEFAQDVSDEYSTLDDLIKATADKIAENHEAQIKEYKIQKLYDAILDKFDVALPESMIQAELENSWRKSVSQSGMPEKQLIELLGYQDKTKEDLLTEWRPQAHKNILIQMLLEKVAAEEKIEASDEDIADMMPQLDGIEDQKQKDYYIYLLKEEKKSQKVIDLLLEKNEFKTGKKVSYTDFIQNKID